MSRSGYGEEIEDMWPYIRYRGQVSSAIRGKRGQKLLKELARVLDEMPVKELIDNELESGDKHCALGVLGKARGLDLSQLDTYDHENMSEIFGIAPQLIAEIMSVNDEYETCDDVVRWKRVKEWVTQHIKMS